MGFKKHQECERTKIERLAQFQFSHHWKKIGWIFSILIFVSIVALKFVDIELNLPKEILRRLLLLSLLIIIMSKEKIEDEMIVSLRAKAFSLAFVMGVFYAVIQPILDGVLHNIVFNTNSNNGFSYFEILFYMLMVQIMFFEILKRNR